MDLLVRTTDAPSVALQPVEIVERKGLGHPDTICDLVAEHICVRLCQHYLQRFGVILHHNVDKVLLCGGSARAAFGGGDIVHPIELFLAGRATEHYRGERIPTADIAVEATKEWFRAHLSNIDVDQGLRIIPKVRPGSADLVHLFSKGSSRIALANDTSCGVGFAPATDLERAVLEVERVLNAPETKRLHPEIGSDVKVMGTRREGRIALTIGCAFVGRFISNIDDYAKKKAATTALAFEAARSVTSLDVAAEINVADDIEREQVFLTVTGTSAEAGDDGEVGRGNRVGGLITPNRPMTMEAAAGKNPVTHVGKVYNVLANRIAHEVALDVRGARDVTGMLVSAIGRPVDDPTLADIQIWVPDAAHRADAVRENVAEIVRQQLASIDRIREDLLAEKLSVA
jgi:S-adenosylmethionine synthetase